MELSLKTRQKIVDFLAAIPNIENPDVRQALIQSAELDPQLRGQISFVSSSSSFFQLLLSTLTQYGRLNDGRHPVAALLEVAKYALNDESKAYCNGLIRELGEEPASGDTAALPANLFSETLQQRTSTGGNTVNVTIGNGANLKGFNIGDGNQNMIDAKSGGDLIQNRDGNVEIHKKADPPVETKEDMLALLHQLKDSIQNVDDIRKKYRIEAVAEVDKAIAEIEDPDGDEADKQTIAQYLESAAKTLENAGETVLKAVAFGQLAGQAATWLGPPAAALLRIVGM